MTSDLDYAVRRNPAELDSTGYIEIGPGRYSGEHWKDGFLFIWEDAFTFAEVFSSNISKLTTILR